MNVAVFGTGVVGRTIAAQLSGLGHRVTMGTRNPEKTLAKKEPDRSGNPSMQEWLSQYNGIQLKDYAKSVTDAEVVFNCTLGSASVEALRLAGPSINGKILVDVANPLDFANGMTPTLSPGNTDSLGELLQRTFPEVRVVKTLNTMTAAIMVNPSLIDGDHNVFISGNDASAKGTVKELLRSFGWKEQTILDLGDITTARGTEQLLPIWLRLWGKLQTPYFTFNIVRKATS